MKIQQANNMDVTKEKTELLIIYKFYFDYAYFTGTSPFRLKPSENGAYEVN